jgi:phosphopantothenoylcysteine decarboxylase / phosphopantothenate---cysteine ligase
VRLELAYLVVTGTTSATRAPELIAGLRGLVSEIITLMTPNARRVISPWELASLDGHQVVESYFDRLIRPRPRPGLVLVAPCSFNSLNKLAAGIADNLALSVAAEAIGRQTPVVVAPSVNQPLLDHPRTAESCATLQGWGVSIVPPEDHGDGPRLAPTDVVLAEVARQLDGG